MPYYKCPECEEEIDHLYCFRDATESGCYYFDDDYHEWNDIYGGDNTVYYTCPECDNAIDPGDCEIVEEEENEENENNNENELITYKPPSEEKSKMIVENKTPLLHETFVQCKCGLIYEIDNDEQEIICNRCLATINKKIVIN